MTPLFDSLAHPTLTGRWAGSNADAGVECLLESMHEAGFTRACAVGLAGVEAYSHAAFAKMCEPHPQLVPIAGIDPQADDVATQLDEVVALRYRGIKLHARLSGFSLSAPSFRHALTLAQQRRLVVFLCTYFHAPVQRYPRRDPLYDIVEALQAVPECRMILVHGGDVELMRYAQLARHTPNLLLDLSHTMMKYRGSSLDGDLRYLMRSFNRRVCIGADFPDYGHRAVRERFEELGAGLSAEELAAAGSGNLVRFLGLREGEA